jgi:[NiFe] hydrogenase diaphorase moiety small subunit
VRASRDLDGKHVFDFAGRGPKKHIVIAPGARMKDTEMDATDKAAAICPVGAINKKGTAYRIPIGQREYDHEPIGTEIEKAHQG